MDSKDQDAVKNDVFKLIGCNSPRDIILVKDHASLEAFQNPISYACHPHPVILAQAVFVSDLKAILNESRTILGQHVWVDLAKANADERQECFIAGTPEHLKRLDEVIGRLDELY
jgi:hypothetical protein